MDCFEYHVILRDTYKILLWDIGLYLNKEHYNKNFNSWSYNKTNYIIFVTGLISIISGYIIMSKGAVYSFQSLKLAPILLFFGYIILIPISLFYHKKSDSN